MTDPGGTQDGDHAEAASAEPWPVPHMGAEEFRRHGHAVIDWIADYLDSVERRPVRAAVAPGSVRSALPPRPPADGEPFEAVLEDLDRVVVPALTHWQHPGFFAYFPASASGPSILGELLSAGLGVQGMLWSTSPAATELETHVLDWLQELLGLPARFRSDGGGGGVIQDSASSATLCALLAARHRALGGAERQAGTDPALVVYTSTQAHSSVEKAVRVAGLGSDRLRLAEVDAAFAMRPESLAGLMDADAAAGRRPCMVVASVGTTSSGAIDPVAAIGEVARRHGAWLHVDAAYAGVAALDPALRGVNDGLEHADSYVTNPHKWLLVNFDCSAFYVADRAALTGALGILPEYLRNPATEAGQVIDYRDWMVPLGRRFRALKLWAVLRWYGAAGLRAHIRACVELAGELAGWVQDHPQLELAAPPAFGLVCFRHAAGDEASQALLEAVNATGQALLSSTVLDGHYTLRVAIGAPTTRRRHVAELWALLQRLTAALDGPTPG